MHNSNAIQFSPVGSKLDMSYSYDDLLAAYKKLGVEKGRVLYVGASLPYLREFNIPGKTAVLDAHFNALLELLGEEGTIVVFTQTINLCNTKIPFDPKETPSISGVFSEYIRKKPGACRSFHPFCSYTAYGKYAREITSDTARHAYGPETPIARLIDMDTLCISIGLPPWLTCSAIHHLELIMGVPYRYVKEFCHPVVRNGEVVEELFYLYVWYRECDLKWKRLVKLFEYIGAESAINYAEVGQGQISSYSLSAFSKCTINLFKSNIYMFFAEPPKIRPYRN